MKNEAEIKLVKDGIKAGVEMGVRVEVEIGTRVEVK